VNLAEAVRSAFANLGAHKLRSVLTMLGMIFGVGAVIAMLSIGAGAERQALDLIERMGLRNVVVVAKDMDDAQLEEVRKKSLGVSERDARAIAEGIPGVEATAPRVEIETYEVLAEGRGTEATVIGVSHRQAELAEIGIAEGRFLDALDDERFAQTCVIGPGVRRDLFGAAPVLGRHVKINDVWFEVAGVLRDPGGADRFEGVDLGTTATEIYIPATTAARKFDRDPLASPLDAIVVRVAASKSPTEVAAGIRRLLHRIHGGADDFDLIVPEALLAQSRRTQRLFNVVMGCIAGISLVVGGIGIMNIMLATVLERTREIGIRRALGARRRDIRNQFLIEAFAISVLGGAAGIVAGVALAGIVAASAGWETVVTPVSVALSTGVSVAVGLASGYYPAVRAAALDPIEALRYE